MNSLKMFKMWKIARNFYKAKYLIFLEIVTKFVIIWIM